MSKRHVEEYYVKMASDYTEMKNVLEELQRSITDEAASDRIDQLKDIKEMVRLLESNYKRLSYIMFLLNMPNRKSKEASYIKREKKKLSNIPINARKEYIEKEKSEVIEEIKNIK